MSEALQIIGFALIVAGVALWLGLPAGLISAGLVVLLIGEAVDRPRRRKPKDDS